MRKLALGLALFVTACGGAQQPAPEAPPAAGGGAMSPEDCEAKGGYVKGDIGDGKVACAEDETQLGRVAQGIEGAVCCVAPKQ